MDKEHYLSSKQEAQVTRIISTLQDWINKYAKKNQIIDPLIFLNAFHEFKLVVEQECVGQGIPKEKIDLIKRNAEERFEIKHRRMLDRGDFI
jgi:hypothetical protein